MVLSTRAQAPAIYRGYVHSFALVNAGYVNDDWVAFAPAKHYIVLRYNKALDIGYVRCSSRPKGLTCISRLHNHGFFLSREKQSVW